MQHRVASFEVHHTRFLDATGQLADDTPPGAADADAIRTLYRWMMLARTFDTRAVRLQRTGQLGTYPSSLGQEAIHVGVADALAPRDVFLPTYRELGAQLLRGVTPVEMLLYWGGDERGSDFQGPRQDFPVCVPIATQATHAAGVASAFRLRGEDRVALCMLGDGATSKGDFYEALNLAGVWRLPVVFVVANNRWAISVPLSRQTAAATLAQKAVAAGVHGEQVDGNDLVAVRHVTRQAVERARAGEGPALIECLSYRLGDHTTADDARRYRSDDEVSERWKEDPLPRLRTWLNTAHGWSSSDEEQLVESCTEQMDAAVKAYLSTPPAPPESLFDHLYAELPAAYAEQREQLRRAATQEAGDG